MDITKTVSREGNAQVRGQLHELLLRTSEEESMLSAIVKCEAAVLFTIDPSPLESPRSHCNANNSNSPAED
jgi:hypothetical protein